MSQPDRKDELYSRAVDLQLAGKFTEALEVYRALAAIALTVNVALNTGLVHYELGDFEQAEHWLSLAARNRAGDANIRHQLAGAYAALGKIDLAELEYRTAIALAPEGPSPSRLALSGLYLSVGRYPEGWPLLEERLRLHPDLIAPIKVSFPEWLGEPVAGKSLLVWVEQGFGDQIQMARFLNTLKARGAAHITLATRPHLMHLFTTLAGADALMAVSAGDRLSVKTHDHWTRYFSLPHRLGITLANLPNNPYLSAPADRRERWRGIGGASKVGLVWRASPTGFNAGSKNLPPEVAQRLLDRGAVCLHPEETGAKDFADTAAIIEELDLVISIDTAVAHLAGAMGKPCWTLLPRQRLDWRWLRDRPDSPWYPTLRLYRQAEVGDWGPVVDAVVRDWDGRG